MIYHIMALIDFGDMTSFSFESIWLRRSVQGTPVASTEKAIKVALSNP
jgi:hypothetical protein